MNVARNTFWLTLEKAGHVGGALVLMAAVARLLGPEPLAGYGAAVALTAFFSPFLDPGLTTRVIRSTAGGPHEGRPAAEAALSYKLRVGIPVLGLMSASALAWGADAEVFAASVLIGAGLVSMSAGDVLNGVFKGLGRSEVSARLVTGLNVGLLAVAGLAMLLGAGLIGVAVAHVTCRGLYLLVALWLARRIAPDYAPAGKGHLDRAVLIDGIRHLPSIYFLGNLLYVCYLATYRLEGEDVAANWVIGYRAASAVFVLAGAGFEAVLPASRKWVETGAGIGRTLPAYTAWGVLAGVAMYVAAPLTPLVFGAKYVPAVDAIRTLAICVPALVLCGVGHTILMGTGRTRQAFWAGLATLVFGGAAAVPAGMLYGPEGTALSAAAATALGGLYMAVLALRGTRHASGALATGGEAHEQT